MMVVVVQLVIEVVIAVVVVMVGRQPPPYLEISARLFSLGEGHGPAAMAGDRGLSSNHMHQPRTEDRGPPPSSTSPPPPSAFPPPSFFSVCIFSSLRLSIGHKAKW